MDYGVLISRPNRERERGNKEEEKRDEIISTKTNPYREFLSSYADTGTYSRRCKV